MSPEQVDELPLYLAFCLLGAIGEDHEGVRFSAKDQALYQLALQKKKALDGRR